jgi:hypothetical protein
VPKVWRSRPYRLYFGSHEPDRAHSNACSRRMRHFCGRNGMHDSKIRPARAIVATGGCQGRSKHEDSCGVRSVADARGILLSGADKISVNTAAVPRPELITELSAEFGAQAVVLAIDARRRAPGARTVYTRGGRNPEDLDAVAWAAPRLPARAHRWRSRCGARGVRLPLRDSAHRRPKGIPGPARHPGAESVMIFLASI